MKFLALFFLVALTKAEVNEMVVDVVENVARQAPEVPVLVPAQQPMINEHWTQQVREAVNGASNRVSQNMVVVLSGLSETMRDAGLNNTRAFAHLTRAIVTNVVDLTSIVAYLPRLFLLDLPNQFTEVLRLVRRNEVRIPSSVNEAIDSILVLTRQAEESGITNRVFGPVIRFMPNILNGAHDFLQTIFTTMFTVFGAGPLPPSVMSPIPSRSEAEDSTVVVQPAAPVPAAMPSARHYHFYY